MSRPALSREDQGVRDEAAGPVLGPTSLAGAPLIPGAGGLAWPASAPGPSPFRPETRSARGQVCFRWQHSASHGEAGRTSHQRPPQYLRDPATSVLRVARGPLSALSTPVSERAEARLLFSKYACPGLAQVLSASQARSSPGWTPEADRADEPPSRTRPTGRGSRYRASTRFGSALYANSADPELVDEHPPLRVILIVADAR